MAHPSRALIHATQAACSLPRSRLLLEFGCCRPLLFHGCGVVSNDVIRSAFRGISVEMAARTSSDGGVQDRECLINRLHTAPRDVAQ